MKILVTGAKGMLGRDLCPILEDCGYDVTEADRDEFDITDESACETFISACAPNYVIHCAAYTDVNRAEDDPMAELVNAKGAENVAKACEKIGAVIVYISTDYVFDGSKNSPYLPDDKTNPLNAYGRTKLHGEEAVQKYSTRYYIARTSWLYGHHGKNFVETMLALAPRPELKVVDDQVGCPTWTVELANGIVDLIDEDSEYGIYHICGSGETSWYGFAKEIFKQSGLDVNLKPCSSSEFPTPAKRPSYSVMDNEGCCRDWKLALRDYLELRVE